MLLFECLTMIDIYVAFIITYLYSVISAGNAILFCISRTAVVSKPSCKKPYRKFISYSYNYRKLSF